MQVLYICSSGLEVMPDDPHDELPPVVDEFEHELDHKLIGIKGFSVAPTSRGTCYVCGDKILKASYRISYRFRQSSSMEHFRGVHVPCCVNLPIASRANYVYALRRLLRKVETSDDERDMLRTILDAFV